MTANDSSASSKPRWRACCFGCRLSFAIAAMAVALAFITTSRFAAAADRKTSPNIIVILTDDLGYGDVGCYGATKVKTPQIDKLAAGGLRFTDGHCTAATCTPTRYSMLTGEYAFRRKGTNILPGDARLIIEPGRATLPSVLKQAGYATGVVGKWHLGLGPGGDQTDWNGDIKPGPLEIGFDYSFLIPATGDRVPCVYVENHRVVGLDPKDPITVSYGKPINDEPTGRKNPELLKMKLTHGHDMTIVNGISRIGYMTGGRAARWVDEDMADVITAKAVQFIEKHKDKPFFLYFATHDIHVPRVPHQRFVGTSACGTRGDVIHQTDWSVGQVMAALDRHKLADDTLVIFTSDNGPVLDDGYADGAVKDLNGHKPAGPFSGGKYSALEGGTRVPFIVHWPGRVKPGVSGQLVSTIDFVASFAALTGQALGSEAAPDSCNVLPALLGEKDAAGRADLIVQGGPLAIRQGPWKLIPGGKNQAGKEAPPQLFNVDEDVSEKKNLAKEQPAKVKELADLLQQQREAGRTRK